jgi:hypothetical protein
MDDKNRFLETDDKLTRIHDVTAGTHPLPPRGRSDDGNAFLPDPYGDDEPEAVLDDVTAEDMARDYLAMATTGGADVTMESQDAVTEEEEGGPFVEESERLELADDIDGNNPPDAERAPFPTPMRAGLDPARSADVGPMKRAAGGGR